MLRHCKTCNEEHLLEDFILFNEKYKNVDGTVREYVKYRCKKIYKENEKKYKEQNKDKISKKQSEYSKTNREKLSKYGKEYREKNADQIKIDKKEYYNKNIENIKIDQKKRYNENSEEINKQFKEFKQTYDGAIKTLVTNKKYENTKLGQDCDIDVEYINLLLKNQDSKCIYCQHNLGIKLSSFKLEQLSIDRIDSNKFYTKDNIHLTCMFCNFSKNDIDHLLYRKFINVLRGEIYNFDNIKPRIDFCKMKISCKMYDKKKGYDVENTITTSQIKYLLLTQNNKCAITGIEFINSAYYRFPLKMSIDRIDSSQGHHLENCQLILLGINLGKSNKSNDALIQYIQEIRQLPPIPLFTK
jgi:hypothetical protein